MTLLPLAIGVIAGAVVLLVGVWMARRTVARARSAARQFQADSRQDAENKAREILVSAQEKALALQGDVDRRQHELDDREAALVERARDVDRMASEVARDHGRLQRRLEQAESNLRRSEEERGAAQELRERAEADLERVAGLSREQARRELISSIEAQAAEEGERLARKIEEQARATAERRAVDLMVHAAQQVSIDDVVESTVSFIELPSDEMKGRIIGREGRNIRALELATGIDLIVDDTPRSILISSFDPLRREVARVAIDRLVEDGRIHPARIEEVVQKVGEEVDELVDARGAEAAFTLGISDLHPRLIHDVGLLRYRTHHGQNLLQHSLETAMIAGAICRELGARVGVAERAGLLHEIGQVDDSVSSHPTLAAAELAERYREPPGVAEAIRGLHPEAEIRGMESVVLAAANRLSENRPGARKENLAVFIERLRRLEELAMHHPGVRRAFAVKAGKELRVIVDAAEVSDQETYALCRRIARGIEKELSYPGQIKVHVVRETRAVRFAV